MTKRTGTSRTKTKHSFSVPKRLKGKLSIAKFMQKFDIGEKVIFRASPSVQKGLYHHRFHGKTGCVAGLRNKCYEVLVDDNGKKKTIFINPVHLMKVKNGTKNN
jgi:large subunit ribosomal protein L21e